MKSKIFSSIYFFRHFGGKNYNFYTVLAEKIRVSNSRLLYPMLHTSFVTYLVLYIMICYIYIQLHTNRR